MAKKNKYTPAQKMCHQIFVPFICDIIVEAAPVSYLTFQQVRDNWTETIPWDDKFATILAFQSKSFFLKKINLDSVRASDPEFLSELADCIINYLLPYFKRAPIYQNKESAAYEFLTNKIKTENAYLAHARARQQKIAEKREKRAAARAQIVTGTETNLNATPRARRPRIEIKQCMDEYGQINLFQRVNIAKTK